MNLGNKDNSKKIEIKISKDELQLFKAKNKAIRKTIPKIIEDVSEVSAKKFSSGFRNTWRKSRNFYKEEQINFQKNNFKVWGKPLESLEFLIFVTEEFGYLINEASRGDENREDQNVIETLTRLFARICQVSLEVLTLLKHGFAGGAMARWRTIHELVVVSYFIRENGEGIAERYLFHNDVESYKAAIQYQKYCKALGYKPLSKKELNELTVLYESAISKFGTSFKESYGWAIPALKTTRPTLLSFGESVGMDHFRPFFKMASQNVHGGPKTILDGIGCLGDEAILTGPSDVGLEDPGINTAISLSQAAANLFDLFPSMDSLVWMKSLVIISLEVRKSFMKIEENQNARLEKSRRNKFEKKNS